MFLKKVVIGHSVESAIYSILNDCYHLQSNTFFPLFCEEMKDFSLFGTSNKKEIFSKLKLILGFLGKNLSFEEEIKINISESRLRASSDELLLDCSFEECFIFDLLNVRHENPPVIIRPDTYDVYDDFKVGQFGREKTNFRYWNFDGPLLERVHPYNSGRIDGSKYITDALSYSCLSKEELYSFDYSDTMANFKLMNVLGQMLSSSIKRKVKTEHIKRHVRTRDNNTYEDNEFVKFISLTLDEILYG